ncbi:hypothetical protein ACOSQ2_027180 [Xanthoceras sorbifolium]
MEIGICYSFSVFSLVSYPKRTKSTRNSWTRTGCDIVGGGATNDGVDPVEGKSAAAGDSCEELDSNGRGSLIVGSGVVRSRGARRWFYFKVTRESKEYES